MGGARLSRREFLASGALVTLGAGVAGCGSASTPRRSHPPPAPKPSPPAPPPSPPAPTPATSADWKAFGASLEGTLVLPSDPRYASARLVYDLRFESSMPQAIAYCASATDVQRSVDFARSHALTPTPRCGGHSYGGYSTGSGLVIDVSPLDQVAISGAVATVGGGVRLIDLYASCAHAGVLVPAGSCPTVGISGLALGGGIGVVGRRFGLTCDQIQSLTAVSSDARILRVSPDSEPDLYWASRGGGGGNFAIVTEFELSAHPIPPLTLFELEYPWEAAGDLLGAWQRWIVDAPDELWSNCLLLAGGGATSAKAAGVYCGPPAGLAPLLARLVSAVGAQPSSQFSAPNDYMSAMLVEAGCSDLSVAQCHLPSVNPAGTLARTAFDAKSLYVAAPFDDDALSAATRAIADFQSELPALGGGVAFDSYGGAINAPAPDATAFVHRNALCQIQLSVTGALDGATAAAAQAWLERSAGALSPHCDGQAYQNYIDPTLDGWLEAYYGTNLARLVSVKREYDPDDVFHFAQSIPTALTS